MKNSKSKDNCCDPNTSCCSPKSVEIDIINDKKETSTLSESDNISEAKNSTNSVQRRDFIRYVGLGSAGLAVGLHQGFGQYPFGSKLQNISDSAFNTYQLNELLKRGEPEVFSGKELVYIGMPIGGICAGQVYLGGDGKLWLWDIFNDQKEGVADKTIYLNKKKVRSRDGSNFVEPLEQAYPFDQGFSIKINQGNQQWDKSLDFKGFKDIQFKGNYPIAEVSYQENIIPVHVILKAFSPFVPLEVSSSNYPATVMQFSITNNSDSVLSCELTGIMENAVLSQSEKEDHVQLKNHIHAEGNNLALVCQAILDQVDEKKNIQERRDFGSMCLMLLDSSRANAEANINQKGRTESIVPLKNQLIGNLSKTVDLEPNETKEITFLISWHFSNLSIRKGKFKGRFYNNRFKNALEVANDLASNFEVLRSKTFTWTDTFYQESTLPHWLLNRTFINTSILATETTYTLEDGRFWGWEGIGCCPGTCTHVWHYAQAVGRVFPELERNLREKTDFNVIEKSGKIDFRGGLAGRDAADGQAGIVLRSYREHQMSPDNAFLQMNWPHIKATLKYLIDMDGEVDEANGMIYGEQHNTLDAEWFGNIPVITSLYLAALAAGEKMALEAKDNYFANICGTILSKGKENIETLFKDEYFIQKEDPNHPDAIGIGTGCYIDQVFGQSWAFQLGLGRLYNKGMIHSSLDSLWKYNFIKDMGTYRDSLPEGLNGRPYALSGDAGLVMCTWPKGGKKNDWEKHWQFGYFNECMTGFEYQVAGHMLWEGKTLEGLSVTKAIHDRYHPSKRNPYNEIECSDHYARAMASYGVYIAACGFEYHGPLKRIKFDPKINSNHFKAAFIAAEGWGSFSQHRENNIQQNSLLLKNGKLDLVQLSVQTELENLKTRLLLNGKEISHETSVLQNECIVVFNEIQLNQEDILSLLINPS